MQTALDQAGIPYRSGLLASEPPQVLISVPADRIEQARKLVEPMLWGRAAGDGGNEDDEEIEEAPSDSRPTPFPWGFVGAVGSLIALHVGIVAWMIAPVAPGRELLRAGGLLKGGMSEEPWRLISALLLHVDFSHAIWNGVSMLVFAMPLLAYVGYLRTGTIYLAAGIGGAFTALGLAGDGQLIVGSSGAVAGLFGAWIVIALSRTRRTSMPRRARIRTVGIALLVLPSLLSPINSKGHRVSVSSHIGGLATGMVIGAAISGSLLARRQFRPLEEMEP